MRTWQTVGKLVASIQEYGRSDVEQHAALVSEPAVLRYIVGAMAPDQKDSVDLADDEFWRMLRILQTVLECLHDAQKSR